MGKEYKVSKTNLIFHSCVVLGLLAVSIYIFSIIFFSPNIYIEIQWFIIICLLAIIIMLLPLWMMLPYKIVYYESGKLSFKSLVVKKEFNIKDLKSIKTSSIGCYYLNFKFNNKQVSIINSIDGFCELVGNLKRINKDFETKGC